MARASLVFNVGSTVWICPAGVYSVEFWSLGAGGSGGGGRTGAVGSTLCPMGGGGVGAGICRKVRIAVVPGTSYTIVIGASPGGGSGGAGPSPGTQGGDSKFTITSGGTVLALFPGGGGGYASAYLGAAGGFNVHGGKPASNPITYGEDATGVLGAIGNYQAQSKVMIGEGGFGGESAANHMGGTSGSNPELAGDSTITGGAPGAVGNPSGAIEGGGPGGGGAASFFGSGGPGGNGGNAAAVTGAAGTAGSAPPNSGAGNVAYGAGGGGGGAGGSGGTTGGAGANGASGKDAIGKLYWDE